MTSLLHQQLCNDYNVDKSSCPDCPVRYKMQMPKHDHHVSIWRPNPIITCLQHAQRDCGSCASVRLVYWHGRDDCNGSTTARLANTHHAFCLSESDAEVRCNSAAQRKQRCPLPVSTLPDPTRPKQRIWWRQKLNFQNTVGPINILHVVKFIFRNVNMTCMRSMRREQQNKTSWLWIGHCKGEITWSSLDHHRQINFPT